MVNALCGWGEFVDPTRGLPALGHCCALLQGEADRGDGAGGDCDEAQVPGQESGPSGTPLGSKLLPMSL